MGTARWLAVALLALCSLLFSPPLAAAQARVKLVLDWQIQGPQAPFITAKATGKDPKGAITHIKAAEPLSNEATELKRLQLAISTNMVNDEVKKNGLLAIDPDRMQRAIEQMVVAFELPSKPTVAQVFTGAYLPPAADRRLD